MTNEATTKEVWSTDFISIEASADGVFRIYVAGRTIETSVAQASQLASYIIRHLPFKEQESLERAKIDSTTALSTAALMRINAQMFEGTIRVLGQQTKSLHEQVSSTMAVNAELRGQIETLQQVLSNKMTAG